MAVLTGIFCGFVQSLWANTRVVWERWEKQGDCIKLGRGSLSLRKYCCIINFKRISQVGGGGAVRAVSIDNTEQINVLIYLCSWLLVYGQILVIPCKLF
jgi:hypothetical protein